MSLSVKMTKITLENFIGIYTGLGKKKLTVDLSKLLDKDIIIILGDNGTGKSTLSSVLHPLPGTTDKRNKFIREGKEGLKIVEYRRSDGVEYICKVVYTPTKTGHNSKGYLKKIRDGEEVELNPNGNISSYKELLFEELGVSDAILKLANQNDVCKGHVDMTSTERKVNMSSFLPEDIYSHYYSIVDKTYREMKTRINILVESIGKMNDEDVLKEELEKVTSEINDYVEKRDKTNAKISELETRIKIIEKDGDIEKKEKSLLKDIKSFDKELDKIKETLSDIYNDYLSSILDPEDSTKKVTKLIETYKKQINNDKMTLKLLENTIANLKSRRNSISEDIESKNLILKDISSNKSLAELKDLLSSYKKRYNELNKVMSKLNTNLSKEDLISGYDIVATIRSFIDNICEYDYDEVSYVIKHYNEIDEDSINELNNKMNILVTNREKLINQLATLNDQSDLKDILDKRPSECKIDDCPFIANAQKWKLYETKIEEHNIAIDKVDSKIKIVQDQLDEESYRLSIHKSISDAWRYISISMPIINKLPYNEVYSTFDNFLKCIKDKNRLAKCDDFEEFIEIFEDREEYHELKFQKIPSIENEIRILETQGKFIDDARNDLSKLIEQEKLTKKELEDASSNYEEISNSLDVKQDIVDNLEKFYKKKIDYDELYDNMKESYKELDKLNDTLKELTKYKTKLKDKRQKLKEIDDKLNPLTRQREIYKTEQLKILDNKKELASIETDMYKVEIIRDALSIKGDGIPVDALEYFMDNVRQNANVLLSSTFDGSLYLEEFEINSKDFIIPYKRNGDRGLDVSFASSSERSFISLCLTLAIIEEIVSTYGIIILDEIDRGFSDHNKYKFINILGTQIRRVGISQTFMITHNREYYDGYNLGYILFPGHSLTRYDDNDVIKVYE